MQESKEKPHGEGGIWVGPEGGEGGGCVDTWGRMLQAKGAASANALGREQAWCVAGTVRREGRGGLRGRKERWE